MHQRVNARAYVGRFNFSGADQEKKCGVLSGGERNRLHLALTLKSEANVLLLDEPTNDIDVNTLRALEDGLEDFPLVQGIVMYITIAVVMINFIIDILYSVIDPRIRIR